jgi:sporulation protein YlmC with PRC-barrel domain
MKILAYTALALALATIAASAQTPQRKGAAAAQTLPSVPANSWTINNWYKQNVYDPSDNTIGDIKDVLVDRAGKITALVVGVGGFLGIGEKDVAVPFNAVQVTTKDNNKFYLVMNATKDALKAARGLKYDRNATTWVAEDAAATTGSPATPRPKR